MKKNKMMRLASLLLVAVLLTTSVIGGTFAKYTTEMSANDSARVAAWGFGEDTTVEFDLFSTSYDGTVLSSNADNVIAPGTAQTENVKFAYKDTTGKGAPEVDYVVTLAVDEANTSVAESIKNNPAITWCFNGTTYGTWDAMITAIKGYSENVEAGKLPTLASEDGLTIGWKWEFLDTADQNKTDTDMGNAASLAECKLAIKLTAAQVD